MTVEAMGWKKTWVRRNGLNKLSTCEAEDWTVLVLTAVSMPEDLRGLRAFFSTVLHRRHPVLACCQPCCTQPPTNEML